MTDSNATELLCCPFCGGEAECHAWWSATISGKYATFCTECGSGTDYYNTEAEAIEAWNTRAERTCRVVSSRFEVLVDEWCFDLSCGHAIWFSDSEPPRYCHECGAKVVCK